jgi:hypothetical protein
VLRIWRERSEMAALAASKIPARAGVGYDAVIEASQGRDGMAA